jgi:hypothetical protein
MVAKEAIARGVFPHVLVVNLDFENVKTIS